MTTRIILYTKPDCELCEKAKEVLNTVAQEFGVAIVIKDITSDPETYERYKLEIPVVYVNGRKAFKYRVDADRLRRLLSR